jgi:hypothetical protein
VQLQRAAPGRGLAVQPSEPPPPPAAVIESRWVSQPLAFAGELRPPRLNHRPHLHRHRRSPPLSTPALGMHRMPSLSDADECMSAWCRTLTLENTLAWQHPTRPPSRSSPLGWPSCSRPSSTRNAPAATAAEQATRPPPGAVFGDPSSSPDGGRGWSGLARLTRPTGTVSTIMRGSGFVLGAGALRLDQICMYVYSTNGCHSPYPADPPAVGNAVHLSSAMCH